MFDRHLHLVPAVDQRQLAAGAGIALPPSTLLMFGNPALGSQFITAKGEAGLDWPVRLLVQQDADGNADGYFDYVSVTTLTKMVTASMSKKTEAKVA